MPQAMRFKSLALFKSGKANVLIATDVASRGLDIPTVQLVLNYDIPSSCETYLHRVGRTARAGRGGKAVCLVTQFDIELIHNIEDFIGKKLEECVLDQDEVLQGLNEVTTAQRAAKLEALELEDRGFVSGRQKTKKAVAQQQEREQGAIVKQVKRKMPKENAENPEPKKQKPTISKNK